MQRDRGVKHDGVHQARRTAAGEDGLDDGDIGRDIAALQHVERSGMQAQIRGAPHRPQLAQPSDSLHMVDRGRRNLVDALLWSDDAMPDQARGLAEFLQGARHPGHERERVDAEENVRRAAGIDERPKDVEDGALAPGGERLADRRDVLEGRVVIRGEVESVTELVERPAGFFRRGVEIDPERGEQVGAAALGSDAAVSVRHYLHARTCEDEYDYAGNIE